jgi:hypothetical protein
VIRAILLAAFVVGTCGLASAQVSIDPATPKAFFEIRVKVKGTDLGLDMDAMSDFFEARRTTVSMSGNRITVSPLMIGSPDFSGKIPTPNLDQTIGALPPGTYQLDVVKRATGRGSAGPVGSTLTFTVAPRHETDPLANFTDLWWAPDESGWGFGLFHHPSHQVFGTVFLYGSDSKPVWYVMPGGAFTAPDRFEGPVYKTTGPYFAGWRREHQLQRAGPEQGPPRAGHRRHPDHQEHRATGLLGAQFNPVGVRQTYPWRGHPATWLRPSAQLAERFAIHPHSNVLQALILEREK